MAEATVSMKLSPEEFRTLLFALDMARQKVEEMIEPMAPSDGRALKAQLLKIKDLLGRL